MQNVRNSKPSLSKRRVSRNTSHVFRLGLTTAILSVSYGAQAQNIDPFRSIENRVSPEYQVDPIMLGGFEVTPTVRTDIEYVDNIFASEDNTVSDTIFSFLPSVNIRDRRPDRLLGLRLDAGYDSYLEDQVSDRVRYQMDGTARFGLGRSVRPYFGFKLGQNDTRGRNVTNFSEVGQPLQLNTAQANAGLDFDLGPMTLTGSGDYKATNYDGDIVFDGVSFDGSLRDFDIKTGRVRLAYSVNPAQKIYGEVSATERSYSSLSDAPDDAPAALGEDRSSEGMSVRIGASRQITELLEFDFNIGYLRHDFDDSDFDAIESVSWDGSLSWSPSQLTRITGKALRAIDATSDPFSNGLLRTQYSVRVEHELKRNIILASQAQYSITDRNDDSDDGTELLGSLSARYLLSPAWSLRLRGEYYDRKEIFPGTQNRLLFGVQYNF